MNPVSLPGFFSYLPQEILPLILKNLDTKDLCHLSYVSKSFANLKVLKDLIKTSHLELKVTQLAEDALSATVCKTASGKMLAFPINFNQEAIKAAQLEFQKQKCKKLLMELFHKTLKAFNISTIAILEIPNGLEEDYQETFNAVLSGRSTELFQHLEYLRITSLLFLKAVSENLHSATNLKMHLSFHNFSKKHSEAILQLFYSKKFNEIVIRTKEFSTEVKESMNLSLSFKFSTPEAIKKIFQVTMQKQTTILTLMNPA